MADHNDPNAVNSIFSDIDYSAADLYDLFGWPVDDGKSTVIALTFASVPKAGELDPDQIHTPGIFVQRILQGKDYKKPIERVTTRPRPAGGV